MPYSNQEAEIPNDHSLDVNYDAATVEEQLAAKVARQEYIEGFMEGDMPKVKKTATIGGPDTISIDDNYEAVKGKDAVKSPSHYRLFESTKAYPEYDDLEAVHVICALVEDPESYLEGSYLKYALRWRRKHGEQDLDKMQRFLDMLRHYRKTGRVF